MVYPRRPRSARMINRWCKVMASTMVVRKSSRTGASVLWLSSRKFSGIVEEGSSYNENVLGVLAPLALDGTGEFLFAEIAGKRVGDGFNVSFRIWRLGCFELLVDLPFLFARDFCIEHVGHLVRECPIFEGGFGGEIDVSSAEGGHAHVGKRLQDRLERPCLAGCQLRAGGVVNGLFVFLVRVAS